MYLISSHQSVISLFQPTRRLFMRVDWSGWRSNEGHLMSVTILQQQQTCSCTFDKFLSWWIWADIIVLNIMIFFPLVFADRLDSGHLSLCEGPPPQWGFPGSPRSPWQRCWRSTSWETQRGREMTWRICEFYREYDSFWQVCWCSWQLQIEDGEKDLMGKKIYFYILHTRAQKNLHFCLCEDHHRHTKCLTQTTKQSSNLQTAFWSCKNH